MSSPTMQTIKRNIARRSVLLGLGSALLCAGGTICTCRAADPPTNPATAPPAAPETPEAIPAATRLSPSAATPAPMSGIIDPAARSLIDQMQTAQMSLNSYSAKIALRGDFGKDAASIRIFLAYQKFGKVYRIYLKVVNEAEKSTQTFVSDGKYCYGTDASAPLTYTRDKVGEGFGNFIQMIAQSDAGFLTTLPLAMATGGDAVDETQQQISVVRKPDATVDGAARDVIQTVSVDVSQSSTNGVATTTRDVTPKTFTIGKTDHLLRRCQFAMTGTGGAKEDQQTAGFTFTFTEVKVNPALPQSLFVFTPPLGATATQPTPDPSLAPAGAGAATP